MDYPLWIEDLKDTLEDPRPGMGDFIERIEGLRERAWKERKESRTNS